MVLFFICITLLQIIHFVKNFSLIVQVMIGLYLNIGYRIFILLLILSRYKNIDLLSIELHNKLSALVFICLRVAFILYTRIYNSCRFNIDIYNK
jgi:hypothetical protein